MAYSAQRFTRLAHRLSWSVTLFCALIIGIILISYLYYSLQSYRGPSPIYFCIILLLYLVSKKAAFFSIVFLLPIAPALHEQLSFIHQPAVPFFIATPGIDICTAFIVGTMLNNIAEHQKLLMKAERVPWPIAVTLIIIIFSIALAVFRNFTQVSQGFNFAELVTKLLVHKLVLRGDIYLPLVDIFTFSTGALFIGILVNFFKTNSDSEKLFVMALACTLCISAVWGIFQALTRFGLPPTTYAHRANDFFYGAHGFQPDLHAFGALMLMGCLGLLGYFNYAPAYRTKVYLGGVILISWTALLMSKSRASLAFAIAGTTIFIILKILHKGKPVFFSNYLFTICAVMIGITAVPLFVTSQFVRDIYPSEYLNFSLWNDALSLRPEFHRTALRMFADFPWFGIGQGNFIRVSADPILKYSPLILTWGGENAHNYFLQTLAELGVIGVLSFILLFVWPLIFTKTIYIAPACMIITSIFLGNIYSHSLIVRENLFVLGIVIALTYSKMKTRQKIP